MSIAYLNGEFLPLAEARISPMDRGFLFADGIYEVIPVYGGTPFRLDEHLTRLERSLAEIQLAAPLARADWPALIDTLIRKNGGGNLSLYLQITRGTAAVRDHAFPPPGTPPTVFAMASPMSAPAADSPDTTAGVAAITVPDIRWLRCDIKSVSLLPNILMRQRAVSAGATEAIMLRDGLASEGAASNLFIVHDGTVITPPKDHLILGGITRDLVLELCAAHNVPYREAPVTEANLRGADEIWLTSSTREMVPVVNLDGQAVSNARPGPVWRRVARLYVDFKRHLCGL
ncbi:d-alanine aminotransferase [Isoalcanivorax pacificus W11-5]|uniref:Aminodeoxychorismate lyase n=1 Tax=Isoalcanivorax pacificus W11-5 TaxID=391936 RepID=A0A0B4XRQ8_9GAMM|nr:D-amino acid aminotransferase [Isoalcanivorax pacificus]AJD49148.1 d-alanine aminotransferase [Isoalcanivorax pacificus W11-5]